MEDVLREKEFINMQIDFEKETKYDILDYFRGKGLLRNNQQEI